MNRRALGCLFELVETLLLALIVFFVVQLFIAQPYEVQQQSMEDTLMPSQYILVDKLTPRFDPYARGDIIVFNPPGSESGWVPDPTGTPYVKRVIGVPGDRVSIHDGAVFVNGVKLTEPYLFGGQPTTATGSSSSWTLKTDEYFVMGDHRMVSQDSREFGPITKESIIGRAWLRYWPMDSFGVLSRSPQEGIPSASPGALPSVLPSVSPSASRR